MRQFTIGLSLLALFLSFSEPTLATSAKPGVPGRRVGGGSRWTQPKLKQSPSASRRLSAMTFASRNNLPVALKLKAIYS
jgi:hypothetical protein